MKKENKGKLIGILIIISALALFGAIFYFIGRPMLEFVSEPQRFKEWIDQKGLFGRVVFVFMVILQIFVAIIPGEPIEIVAGYAFGPIEGTLLCMIGILLGSLAVFSLVRVFGIKLLLLFFSQEKIDNMKFLNNTKRIGAVLFLLFFIPGTPKDLLTYFAGLTRINTSAYLIISCLARIPSVITSTVGGDAISSREYMLAIIVFASTAIVSLIGWLIYNRINAKK